LTTAAQCITEFLNCMFTAGQHTISNHFCSLALILSCLRKEPNKATRLAHSFSVIPTVASARDLGVVVDSQLTMSANVSSTCRSAYNQLQELRPVVRSLSVDAAKTAVQSFVSTRLDYCNSLKLAVLVFKALHGQAPQCLTDDCQLVAASGRRQLRSSDAVTCSVPRTRTCFGDRAFGVAGPRLWNALPIILRQPHLCLGQFRRELKTPCDCDCDCVCRA